MDTTATADRAPATANGEAGRLGVTGTPTFVIERDGSTEVVDAAGLLGALER